MLEAFKVLAAAMEALKTAGLDKGEVLRLRNLIQSATVYQAKVAELFDYRRIKSRLAKIEEDSPLLFIISAFAESEMLLCSVF